MKKKLCLVAMLCVLLVFMGIILAACSGVTIAQDPNSGNVTVRPAGPDKTPESNPSEGSTETSPTTPRYAVTLAPNDPAAGTVTGAGEYESGAFVTISATTNAGYRLLGWYKGDILVSNKANYTFEMPAHDVGFTAKYEYTGQYTVTLGTDPVGAVNVSGAGVYTSGSFVTVTASSAAGFELIGWYSGTVQVSDSDSYTFEMPEHDVTLTARFAVVPISHSVALSVDPVGAGVLTGAGARESGSFVSVNATANDGYQFLGWYIGNVLVSNRASYVFEMPDHDVTLTARFETEGSSNPEETPALYTRINADGTGSETGEYILFGSYPQSSVTDDSLVSALNAQAGTLPTAENRRDWTSYNYYIEGSNKTDYMWYIDVTYDEEKYRGVYFTSYRPYVAHYDSNYNHQEISGYDLGNVYWFKYEPIRWRILAEENGKAFLLAEMIIDGQMYQNTYSEDNGYGYNTLSGVPENTYANNYEYSTIRAWLNNAFYDLAFNSAEKEIVCLTEVDNSSDSTYPYNNVYGQNDCFCNNTEDKVFLLSRQEVTNGTYGFDESGNCDFEDAMRQRITTAYAKIQGLFTLYDAPYAEHAHWWLRSPRPSNDSDAACFVGATGNASSDSFVDDIYGIVPALWINLGNATISPDTLDPVTLTVNIEGGEGTLRINNEPFSGTGTYDVNECFVIYVTPNFGYEVLGWYKNNDMCGAGNQFLITMTEDTTLTIRMQQRSMPMHRVLLLVEEEGTGSVMFMMGGTSATYVSGASFVALASPAVGYEFVGWYDENDNIVSSTTPSSFTVPDHDMTLTAKFAPGSGYTLTINRDPGEPGIPLMLINGLKQFYVEGEVVTITVAPSVTNSHAFVGWYDGDEFLGEAMTYSITMPDHDVVLTAKFERLPDYYTITNQSNIEGAGSISTGYIYQCGEEVSLWATPIYGYDFLGWYEGDTLISSDADYSFNMPDRDLVYTACFGRSSWCDGFADCTFVHPTFPSMDAYMSIVRLDTCDGIVPQTTLSICSGNKTLRFACSDRNKYWFTMETNGMQVTFNGTYNGVEYVDEILSIRGRFLYSPLGSADWRFTDGDHGTVEAIYANNPEPVDMPYTVTIIRDPMQVNNSLLYGADSYQSGEEVHLFAESTIQYNFDGWYDGDSLITTDPDYTFIMPDHNMTFVAKFTVPIVTYACGDYAEGDLPEPSIPVVMGGLYVNIATNPIPTCTREGNWKFIGWSRTDGSFSPEYALGRNMYERNLEQLGSITLYPVFREEVTPDGYITIDCTNSDEMTVVIEKDGEYYDYCSNTDASPYVLGYVIGSSYRFITTRNANVSFEGVYSNSKYAENENYFDLRFEDGGDYDWQGMICNVDGNVNWSFADGDYGTISCNYKKP